MFYTCVHPIPNREVQTNVKGKLYSTAENGQRASSYHTECSRVRDQYNDRRYPKMTDLITVFLLGPLFFFPLLLNVTALTSGNLVIFIASGLGTMLWTIVITVIGGLIQ